MALYIKNTHKLYSEMSKEDINQWFTRKSQKFIYHIDSLYYTVKCDDWKPRNSLVKYLNNERNRVEKNLESIPLFSLSNLSQENLVMQFGLSFGFYKYHIGKKDCFDIFIADTVPSDDTPSIFVQLRSQYLWLEGTRNAVHKSLNVLKSVLDTYGLNMIEVNENRIDYAFHTNYIQDPLNFFKEKDLAKMQISRFNRWHKEGIFKEDMVECDYFTLGRRKSKNLFFRVYNKSKEVVEKGYKQFFLYIWLYSNLISKYDAYVYEKMFQKGNWNYMDRARLLFYLENGTDEPTKELIHELLENGSLKDIRILANELTPTPTIICNIEFQTQRKFYTYIDNMPNVYNREGYSKRIEIVLDLESLVVDYITKDVLRFVNYKGKYKDMKRTRRPMANWWKRLRNANDIDKVIRENYTIIRKYQHNLDIEKQRRLAMYKVASLSVYQSNKKKNFTDDVLDFISSMNDNDIEDYYRYKDKKISQLENQLTNVEYPTLDSNLILANKVTGELI